MKSRKATQGSHYFISPNYMHSTTFANKRSSQQISYPGYPLSTPEIKHGLLTLSNGSIRISVSPGNSNSSSSIYGGNLILGRRLWFSLLRQDVVFTMPRMSHTSMDMTTSSMISPSLMNSAQSTVIILP